MEDNEKKPNQAIEELWEFYEAYRSVRERMPDSKKVVRSLTLDDKIRDVNPYFQQRANFRG
jgi:hypothetical protein